MDEKKQKAIQDIKNDIAIAEKKLENIKRSKTNNPYEKRYKWLVWSDILYELKMRLNAELEGSEQNESDVN